MKRITLIIAACCLMLGVGIAKAQGVYTMLGALHDGGTSYDPTCLFMTYGSNPSEFTAGDLIYRVNDDNVYRNSNWYDPTGLNGFYEFIEAEPTAVAEAENTVSAVYPNPTKEIARIEAEDMKNITIFNSLGAKIFETSVSCDAFEYDFSHQAAGTYFIKVETTKGVETKRVTVL